MATGALIAVPGYLQGGMRAATARRTQIAAAVMAMLFVTIGVPLAYSTAGPAVLLMVAVPVVGGLEWANRRQRARRIQGSDTPARVRPPGFRLVIVSYACFVTILTAMLVIALRPGS